MHSLIAELQRLFGRPGQDLPDPLPEPLPPPTPPLRPRHASTGAGSQAATAAVAAPTPQPPRLHSLTFAAPSRLTTTPSPNGD